MGSSGFWCCPWHATSDSAVCIALPHRHVYLSKWPVMEVHSFIDAASFVWRIVSKQPCYGPLKLTPSSNINLVGLISLFVCYWLPPTTMDAVLATIVAGGRDQFWQIVHKFLSTINKTQQQTSPPRWAVCPPCGLSSMNCPNPTHGQPSEGVGQGRLRWVLFNLIK